MSNQLQNQKTQPDLIPTTAAEKLQHHEKIIKTYIRGQRKGTAETFGYAYLCGRELLLAKDHIPHGNTGDNKAGFQKWIQSRFGKEITIRTCQRWMVFAQSLSAVAEQSAASKKTPLMITTRKFTAADRKSILDLIPQVMDGKSMLNFMRDSALLRAPEKPIHHPRKPLTIDEKSEAAARNARSLWQTITSDLTIATPAAAALPTEELSPLIDALVDASNSLRALLKTRKEKAK